MKILMLLDIPEETGSWIGRFYPIAKGLVEKGHQVKVLMPHKDYPQIPEEKKILDGVLVEFMGTNFFREREFGAGRNYYTTLQLLGIGLSNLLRVIKRSLGGKYDLVYVCKPLPVSSLVGFIIALLERSNLVVDCDDYEAYTNFATNFTQRTIIKLFENYFPRFCRLVIVNTTFTGNRLIGLGTKRKKIIYLPNGIATWRFESGRVAKKKEAGKNILYFGDLNLSTGHNVDILLEAFKTVLTKFPRARLTILGGGKDGDFLKGLAGDLQLPEGSIRWAGRVPPEEVEVFLTGADVVVDPVREHPGNLGRCPLKILEAMYVGVPVVTSAVGDRRKLLGEAGTYVDSGSDRDLARGIIEVFRKGNEEINALIRAEQKGAEKYQWPLLIDKLESVLESMR